MYPERRAHRARGGWRMTWAVFALLCVLAAPTHAQQQLPSMLDDVAAQVSAGQLHTCALSAIGAVKCWGANDSGELGDGTNQGRTTPTDVGNLGIGNVAVAAGAYHSCVLTQAGAVKCWGNNTFGQLGDGSTANSKTPVDVTGLSSGVAAIAAGGIQTCALTTAGKVLCWGRDGASDPQNPIFRKVPSPVSGLPGVVAIAAGSLHTCALTEAGAVKCWGNNGTGQLGNGTRIGSSTPVDVTGLGNVIAIAAGYSHTCALIQTGAAKCWGYNDNGQLGNGTTDSSNTPVGVSGLSGGARSIAAGVTHTCAVTNAGAVQCWGGGDLFGPTPSNVAGLESGIATVAAGFVHSCAVTATGGIKCWMINSDGQLGDGTTTDRLTPVDVVGFAAGVKRPLASEVGTKETLGAGFAHTCALTTAGGVKCWGNNNDGELGNGATQRSSTPVDATGLTSGVAAIAVGNYHACALAIAGGVKCWGGNAQGQLGDGTTQSRSAPVDVVGLTSGVAAIAAGSFHTCARTTAGEVKCWGRNAQSQLGDGTTQDRNTPVDVAGLTSGVAAIAAGGFHTCALTTAGGVKCWGYNSDGELGDGTTQNRSTPVDVTSLTSGVAVIAAGSSHTCALTTAGGIKCWGYNSNGGLGNGTLVGSPTPVDVIGLTGGVTAIAAGGGHTCALTTMGGIKCWGLNSNGQLGNGAIADSSAPVDVTGLTSGVAAIAIGYFHTCALTTAGGLQCWGNNGNGQLGNHSTTERHIPIVVRGGQTLAFTPALTMAPGSSQALSATASANAPVSYAIWTDDAAATGTCHLNGAVLSATRTALCGAFAASNVYDDGNGNNYAPAPTQYRLIRVTANTGTTPAFTSASSATFTTGQPGSFTVSASGTPAPSISTPGTLPAWLTLTDHGDGTATLAGTPPAGSIVVTIPLNASNSAGTASQSLTLNIVAAAVTHIVTPRVNIKTWGSISPNTPQTVNDGATATFVLTQANGYAVDGVGGTCGGTLSGDLLSGWSYTTSAVKANCTVVVDFREAKNRTTTTLTASPNPAATGQQVTFVATVTATPGTGTFGIASAGAATQAQPQFVPAPGGSVVFSEGATELGSVFINPGSTQAIFTTSSLSVGTHVVTATYQGTINDEIYLGSSASVTVTINGQPAGPAVPAPALDRWAMLLMVMALGGMVWRRSRG